MSSDDEFSISIVLDLREVVIFLKTALGKTTDFRFRASDKPGVIHSPVYLLSLVQICSGELSAIYPTEDPRVRCLLLHSVLCDFIMETLGLVSVAATLFCMLLGARVIKVR